MMMKVLDQATRRRAVKKFLVLVLLTFSSCALASNSPISGNVKSRRCSPDVKVHDRTERKLAVVPAPEPAVFGNASAPSPSHPRPPPPPPNSRPALLSPSDDTPGTDLPPRILSPPPASEAPKNSPIRESKQSTLAFILICTCVLIMIGVSFIVTALWCPEFLPCSGPRSSPKIRDMPDPEREVPL